MSYLGIVISSLFATNVFLFYGLGICPGFRIEGRGSLATALGLALVNALAATILWCIRTLALKPLGLESIDLFVFAVIAVPLLKTISQLLASKKGILSDLAHAADDSVISCLVFGIALLGSRSGYSMSEGLVAGACSGFGYWMATSLLGALKERLELSNVPASFRGAPAMLLSAGLMSMALMGIDSILIKNITV